MEKDVMCVLNEGLEGMKGVPDEGWSMLVWGRGGRRLDGLSGILGGGCDLVMVRVGEGLEKGLWKNQGG